jgi:acetate kinase
VRAGACELLAHLGVAVDDGTNAAADLTDPEAADREITAAGGRVRILVVRAREDLEIAAGVERALAESQAS